MNCADRDCHLSAEPINCSPLWRMCRCPQRSANYAVNSESLRVLTWTLSHTHTHRHAPREGPSKRHRKTTDVHVLAFTTAAADATTCSATGGVHSKPSECRMHPQRRCVRPSPVSSRGHIIIKKECDRLLIALPDVASTLARAD